MHTFPYFGKEKVRRKFLPWKGKVYDMKEETREARNPQGGGSYKAVPPGLRDKEFYPATYDETPRPVSSALGKTSLQAGEARAGAFMRVFASCLGTLFERFGLKFKAGKSWWSQYDADLRVSLHVQIPVGHLIEQGAWDDFVQRFVKFVEATKKEVERKEKVDAFVGKYPLM